ncbi:NUDIX hydrolase [Saccharopolyspora sp. 6T]|uniref:NUDIX domain-containing protein n=1 Tax=Saccharopolyspora sp. 6T TaxID=2877238 RepID=UPI001CD7253C|nr:NUDIX hydrolase [Saccharopolyspora sp. 6T]MCA1185767.1 NUDIX hydrolase [Saccharopolyspora sp. 6T]
MSAKRTSDMVLLHQDDDGVVRVLLVQRRWDPYAGRWALPGGHVDPGESHSDAAVRELAEETGVPAEGRDLLVHVGRYDTPGRDPRGGVISEAFVARVDEMTDPTAMDDARDAAWRRVDEVLDEWLAFDHDDILRDALKLVGLLDKV